MRVRLDRLGAWVLIAIASLAPAVAAAQPTPQEKALAEALFEEGRVALAGGRVADACAKLAESQRIVPRLGTLLNLATCHEQLGLTASAWAEFREAAGLAARTQQEERAKYAAERARSLQARLSFVSIRRAAPVMAATVTLDGLAVPGPALSNPIPVDPGEHRIEVTAPDRQPWTGVVQVGPGPVNVPVDVPVLVAVRAAPTQPAARREPPADRSTEPPPVRRWVGMGLVGAGVVSIGVGSYFGVRTFTTVAESNDGPCDGNACTAEGVALRDDAKTFGVVSTVTMGVGVALSALGVVLWATSGGTQAPRSAEDVRVSRETQREAAGHARIGFTPRGFGASF